MNALPTSRAVQNGPPTDDELKPLAELLRAYAPHDGSFELRLPGVYAVRSSRENGELFHGSYRPSLCIVAQGVKRVFLGPDV